MVEPCCGEGCVSCPSSYPVDEALGAESIVFSDVITTCRCEECVPVRRGDKCSSGCLTKDHWTWGECMRDKGLRVLWAGSATDPGMDATFQKGNERELELYRQVRKQGIQPDNTSTPAIRRAIEISDKTGTPYVSKV